MWADAEKGSLQLPTVAVVRDGALHSSISRDQLFRDCRLSLQSDAVPPLTPPLQRSKQ